MSTLKDKIIFALEWPVTVAQPLLQNAMNKQLPKKIRDDMAKSLALILGVGALTGYIGSRLMPRALDYTFGVPGLMYLGTAASLPLSQEILSKLAAKSSSNPDVKANAAEFAQNQAQNGPLSRGPLQPTVRGQTFAPLPKYPLERQFGQHTAQELL